MIGGDRGLVEESGAVRQEGGGDTSFSVGGAEKLSECNKKISTPRSMFRTEEQMLISLDRASVAAATVWGVTIVVAKKPSLSGKEVVDPLGDDDALGGAETADGRAMSWPVD